MRILFVTSEVHPLAKTGGLADVSEALPKALRRMGHDVRLLMPGYAGAKAQLARTGPSVFTGEVMGQGPIFLIPGEISGSELPVWLIDCPKLYERPGGLYCDEQGREWPDNALRFGVLAQVAARIAGADTPLAWSPELVHANDWHAGLVPALLQANNPDRRPASVFTVHNMAFQGNFEKDTLAELALPSEILGPEGAEHHGQGSFLRAGLRFADWVTTVSPSYAREIRRPEFGFGMEDLLGARGGSVSGILNGADYDQWDPRQDRHLPRAYGPDSIGCKAACKAEIERELGLAPAPEAPLILFMSRLAHQKMADVVLEAVPALIENGARFALLGEGDSDYERRFGEMAAAFPGQVAARIGYEEPLARRLLAGGDMLLAPARFEPCGLAQLYAMRYGAVPVVSRVGGLADTVTDASAGALASDSATGIVFEGEDCEALVAAVQRALALYEQPLAWRRLQRTGMRADFSWERSARRYAALYDALAAPFGASKIAPVPRARPARVTAQKRA